MVQIVKLFSNSGYSRKECSPRKGGVQLQADGPGRWFDCQVDGSPSLQVFKWAIRTGRSQMQACWRQEQQDAPFRLDSLRAETAACQLTNSHTRCCVHDWGQGS